MGASVIYLFPLAFDIIVSISLFAGRHSLAERGMDARTVGSLIAIYGIGYIIASLCMEKSSGRRTPACRCSPPLSSLSPC